MLRRTEAPMMTTRRQFLIGAAGTAALAGCGALVRAAGTGDGDAVGSGAARNGDGTLVVVTLYGGNDGLDTVIPASHPAYRRARGDLARTPDAVLDLGDDLGLHPKLSNLATVWQNGHLAVLRGVGFPDRDRSHFHCMDLWQSAGQDDGRTGWLGRWLDAGDHDPVRAIAVGNGLPPLLRGRRTSGSVVSIGAAAIPGGDPVVSHLAQLSEVDRDAPALVQAAQVAAGDLISVTAAVGDAIGPRGASDDPVDGGGAARAGGDASPARAGRAMSLSGQLDVVAELIAAGLPTRAYAVQMGGFDTHANQAPTRDRLMTELDTALGRFLPRVAAAPVTVLVYSEFGRRVAVNASGGTDHGAAGTVLVCGSRVKGGFHGEEPSLTSLIDGDLRHDLDYRSVYRSVLEDVLGIEAEVAIEGASRYRRLALVA